MRLKLAVLNRSLKHFGGGLPADDFHHNGPSISLAKLLTCNVAGGLRESQQKRLLLSWFLAHAVWELYDSNWMLNRWTKNNVHFMIQGGSATLRGIFINEPFLSTRFDEACASHAVDDEFRVHPLPKLQALGIILLELELGIRIEEHILPEDRRSKVPDADAELFAALEMLNKAGNWKERPAPIREAIKLCLDVSESKRFLEDVQGVRGALKKHIINPLQSFYMLYYASGDPRTSDIDMIDLESVDLIPQRIIPREASRYTTPEVPKSISPRATSSTVATSNERHCLPMACLVPTSTQDSTPSIQLAPIDLSSNEVVELTVPSNPSSNSPGTTMSIE